MSVEHVKLFFMALNLTAWLVSGIYGIMIAGPGKWDKAAFFMALSIWFLQGATP